MEFTYDKDDGHLHHFNLNSKGQIEVFGVV